MATTDAAADVVVASLPKRKRDAHRRVVQHVRSTLLLERAEGLRWPDAGAPLGMSRASLLSLFSTEDELFDALNESLIVEAGERLRAAVVAMAGAAFNRPEDAARSLVQTLIRRSPLDRSGLLIRLERRARELRRSRPDPATLRAERRFLGILQEDIGRLLAAIGRAPHPSQSIAARVLLNSYERAFEAWLMSGGSEMDFERSRFATHELPALTLALSRPVES